ncbi:MAG: hypothetical protein L3J88_13785, partial [Gammaproteobacteria bacterium]|nr:hypothetical protein [Gammaproteobacteria bacterium]
NLFEMNVVRQGWCWPGFRKICTMLSGGGEIIHKHATISMLFMRELAPPETVAYFMGFRAGTS